MFKTITMVILVLVPLFACNAQLLNADEPTIIPKFTLEQHLQQIFGSQAKVALAVLKAESNLDLHSINYNCIYGGRSTFCKPQDIYKAWSVDCGISQVNIRGQVCPAELMTLDGNMKAVEKIYKEQGLNAWVSYRNGLYRKYL